MTEPLHGIETLEIEPLSDDALESVTGASDSWHFPCCSFENCSTRPPDDDPWLE